MASLYARTAAETGQDVAMSISRLNLAELTTACEHAGVELGDYDRTVIEWLAQYEPATVAVMAGIISRAHQAA